jgi:hypothetical protein
MPERLGHNYDIDEPIPAQWPQLPHRPAVSGHHERLTIVKGSHDPTAVVPQLALTDLLGHPASVAPGATAHVYIYI